MPIKIITLQSIVVVLSGRDLKLTLLSAAMVLYTCMINTTFTPLTAPKIHSLFLTWLKNYDWDIEFQLQKYYNKLKPILDVLWRNLME